MSRSRWLVILGPPLILVAAAGLLGAGLRLARASAGALPIARPASACVATPGGETGTASDAGARATAGTWWRTSAVLDASGLLTGWRLAAGGAATSPSLRLDLPAASSASGPDRGRIVIAADDGARSSITILDVASGCDRVIDLGTDVARRAIADPVDSGVLVHLLDRASRADIGIWQVAADGHRALVLEPVDGRTLADSGIGRVWATNLSSSADGGLLAVQSCDPEACVTRVLDRASGRVLTLGGEQGDVVGFTGTTLVTMAACHGLPCGVLAWATAGATDGTASVLAPSTLGATVTTDGQVVLAIAHGPSEPRAVAVASNLRDLHDLGRLAGEVAPLAPTSPYAGIEAGTGAMALIDASGLPSLQELMP